MLDILDLSLRIQLFTEIPIDRSAHIKVLQFLESAVAKEHMW